MLKFLKSLFASGPAVPEDRRQPSREDPDHYSRFAELILSEIKLYRGKALKEALRDPALLETFLPDLSRGYQMYVDRTDGGATAQKAFRDAMFRIFSEDAPLLEPVFQKVLLARASEKNE